MGSTSQTTQPVRDHPDVAAAARDRLPEEVVEEAVRRYPREEGVQVRALATRLAKERAELLRRLGG